MSGESKHVQFEATLASPPADRMRLGVSYPSVAQRIDSPDRRCNGDLFWGERPISFVPGQESDVEEQGSSILCSEKPRNNHSRKEEAASDNKEPAMELPLVIREMLSVACEALTSPKQTKGGSKKPDLHLSWSCTDRTADSSQVSTPSISYYGSSNCSTSNSSSNSPSSEAPTSSSILGG